MALDYEIYLSPFSWRYGSKEMRHIWSEVYKRRLWRYLWVTLADVQSEYGLVDAGQVQDLRSHMNDVDVLRALEIEAEIHHDLMAELKTFAEQCPEGGRVIHLGATSADIEDNTDVLRIRNSLELICKSLSLLLYDFTEKIEKYAETPLIAFTHLQPAEPSTLGYRFALYGQDLLMDWNELLHFRSTLRGKGFLGAVGTGATYADLLGRESFTEFQSRMSERLDLPFFTITTQVYPRKQDYQLISRLAGLGGTLYKFAFDLRFLQSPPIGELNEPFQEKQIGSSAMPFKRNPIHAEKINSLARMLAQMPRLTWDNAAHSLLERTLDDSANRRSLLPEAFLITDELLSVTRRIVEGIKVNPRAVTRNLAKYGPFAATERILLACVKAGGDRQAVHERLRQKAMVAWREIEQSGVNPLADLLYNDLEIRRFLSEEQIRTLLEAELHTGDAAQRAKSLAREILDSINLKV